MTYGSGIKFTVVALGWCFKSRYSASIAAETEVEADSEVADKSGDLRTMTVRALSVGNFAK